ncbi:motile sperm domain-containing protein 2-like isoform X2 [Haliotis rubra]|uniref:motile sperm domain-containing protein 2-like isoform X2 n=1 Tax=Haliotis rubra TaxID=36100 RepID=UPI001EE5418B|nr:motile sperm domain-containing protein 2-like isoform X2 [Haliotis rubra]
MAKDELTNENIEYVRKGFEKKYADNLKKNDVYDKRDVDRFKDSDDYVKTFIRGKERLDEAVDLVHESLKWRLEWHINDLTEDSFERWVWDKGALFFHNTDKDGHKILTIRVCLHKKDPQTLPIIKRLFSYHLEQHFKETPHEQVVIMFDMQDAGLSHLDMDLVKYVINSFKYYYPCMLAYMLIFEMPWILNAAWKVIKTWLSAEAAAKIKFVTRSDIQAYINKDQLVERMGGTDKFKYKYVPSASRTEGDGSATVNSAARKRVTFADQDPAVFKSISVDKEDINTNSNAKESKPLTLNLSPSNLRSPRTSPSPMARKQHRDENSFIGRLLTVSPAEELEFNVDENGRESYDIISLTNTLPYAVAYKVKTTSPEKYRVRPSSGVVKAGTCTEVYVYLQAGYQNSTIQKDKFLIMGMDVTDDSTTVSELWKIVPRDSIMEHRLRCVYTSSKGSPDTPTKEIPLSMPEQVARMSKQMDELVTSNNRLEQRVQWLVWSQILMLFAVITAIVAMYFYETSAGGRYGSCVSSLF